MIDELIPQDTIEQRIFIIRGHKVMIDRDLAELYEVENFQLKRQVKRNIDRFPEDFMFILTQKEIEQMVCHFGIPSKSYFGGAEPFAFTEQGVAMLSSVLRSKRAIHVNIQIMRTFTKLRRFLTSHVELRKKIEELENKYDGQFKAVFDAINELMEVPDRTVKNIGFLKEREKEG
jgi:ORF6N domain